MRGLLVVVAVLVSSCVSGLLPDGGDAPAPAAVSQRPSATSIPGASERGIASWGYFGGHVVTRLRRGTSIVVCGPLRCWRGSSWGYGPAARTGRIVDLDRAVFASICGAPSLGLCRVVLSWH